MAQLWRALVLAESQDSVSKAQAHKSLYLWLQGLWGPLLACLGTCTQVTYTYTQIHTHKIKTFFKRKKKSVQSLVCYPPHCGRLSGAQVRVTESEEQVSDPPTSWTASLLRIWFESKTSEGKDEVGNSPDAWRKEMQSGFVSWMSAL